MKQKVLNLMGTRITLQIEHPKAEVLLNHAEEMLKDYEKRFSANDDKSDLMHVNQNAGIKPVQVDEDLFELIAQAHAVSLSSCLLYTSPSPRDQRGSRMPSSA